MRISVWSSDVCSSDLFECSGGTFYDNLFVVAVNSGLRPGEICALEKSDLDFENHMISVTKTLLYQELEGDECKEFHIGPRSAERRVGKECVRKFRSRWSPEH